MFQEVTDQRISKLDDKREDMVFIVYHSTRACNL